MTNEYLYFIQRLTKNEESGAYTIIPMRHSRGRFTLFGMTNPITASEDKICLPDLGADANQIDIVHTQCQSSSHSDLLG
jgi:hypothetical protein